MRAYPVIHIRSDETRYPSPRPPLGRSSRSILPPLVSGCLLAVLGRRCGILTGIPPRFPPEKVPH